MAVPADSVRQSFMRRRKPWRRRKLVSSEEKSKLYGIVRLRSHKMGTTSDSLRFLLSIFFYLLSNSCRRSQTKLR